MIEEPGRRVSLARFSRPLMVSGLGLWGLGVSGALAPPIFRTILYPNHTETPHFDRVAADPFGTPILWTVLVIWCSHGLSSGAHCRSPGRLARGTLLGGTGSPHPESRVSDRVRLRGSGPASSGDGSAYPGDGVVPFLPAVALQLVIHRPTTFLTGLRPRVRLQRADGA